MIDVYMVQMLQIQILNNKSDKLNHPKAMSHPTLLIGVFVIYRLNDVFSLFHVLQHDLYLKEKKKIYILTNQKSISYLQSIKLN